VQDSEIFKNGELIQHICFRNAFWTMKHERS